MTAIINGTTGITFPAGGIGNPAGSVVGTTDTQTLTNKTLSTGLVMGASAITSGTAVVASSGTSVDFTNIPPWVKRITLVLDQVSVSATSSLLVQIGDAGGIETTFYTGGGSRLGAAASASATFTTGFGFNSQTAANTYSGNIILCNITGNAWSASGVLGGVVTEFLNFTAGSKTLSQTLDRVRLTTVLGIDTFDSVSSNINILYE